MTKKRKNKLKEQEDFYIGLPRWLFQSKVVSMREKGFLLTLTNHRNSQTKRCDPGVPLIGREADLCERTVKTYRKKLAKLGVISYTPGTDKKNRAKYKLNWLDGSDEEIMRLKNTFTSHQLVQKRPRLTSAMVAPVTSAMVAPVTSAKETPRTTIELNNIKKNNNESKPAVISSLIEEKNLKPLNQKLLSCGLEYIDKVFVDTGWEGFDQNARENVVCSAITKAKKQTKNDLEDYLRYWKKDIDRKKARNKIGYLISMVGKGLEPPRSPQETTPPYLEDHLQDLQKEEGVEIA